MVSMCIPFGWHQLNIAPPDLGTRLGVTIMAGLPHCFMSRVQPDQTVCAQDRLIGHVAHVLLVNHEPLTIQLGSESNAQMPLVDRWPQRL